MSDGFLLDTHISSEMLRPVPNPKVVAWLEAQSKDVQFVSVVSIGELRRGATLLAQASARRRQLEQYIEVKIPLLFAKRVLSRNVKDFAGLGVAIFDPWALP
jgi:toxin FitB